MRRHDGIGVKGLNDRIVRKAVPFNQPADRLFNTGLCSGGLDFDGDPIFL